MAAGADKASLNPNYLLIALLPALVFFLNQLLLQDFAAPFDIPPARFAEFEVDKEGAARIGMLAAFMLFIGAALAALLFFAYTLCMLDWPGRGMAVIAFLALAAAAVLAGNMTEGREAHDYSGRSLACLAAGYNKTQSDEARRNELGPRPIAPPAASAAANRPGSSPPSQEQPKGVAVAHLPDSRNCRNERFDKMQDLGSVQFIATALSFAGLVIGAICCLAARPREAADSESGSRETPATSPATTPEDDAEMLLHWEKQSEWLNTYLYLAALLLGTGLVFINAYLRWPSFVLLEPESYLGHTAALLSYYGFVFTVMLASFYIPVATILAGKVKALKEPATQGESKLPEAFKGPLQILKIVLGLFSTALAGALPGILELIA